MIIVMASEKGGAGKTTLLCNIAAELARSGQRILLVDCDKLKGAWNWATAREDNPKLPQLKAAVARADKGLKDRLEEFKKSFDHILVDTPGHDEGGHRYVYGAADLLIFPLKPSQFDLGTVEWIKDLDARYKQLKRMNTAIVLNECLSSSKRETREALAYFKHFGLQPTDAKICTRISYRDVIAEGMGITEQSKDKKAADEFRRVFRELMEKSSATVYDSSATL